MNWNVILLAVMTAAVVALVVFLIQLVQRLTRVASAVEETLKTINELSPRVEAVLGSAERELDQLGSVTQRLDRIVGDAERVSSSVAEFVVPVAEGLSSLVRPLRMVGAVVSGLRTGISVLQRFRGGSHPEPGPDDGAGANGSPKEDSHE